MKKNKVLFPTHTVIILYYQYNIIKVRLVDYLAILYLVYLLIKKYTNEYYKKYMPCKIHGIKKCIFCKNKNKY